MPQCQQEKQAALPILLIDTKIRSGQGFNKKTNDIRGVHVHGRTRYF